MANGPVRRLVLASRNEGKLREARQLLAGLPLEVVGLESYPDTPEVPEDGATFAANAKAKALAAARHTREWALADDSGLEVEALGGAPGVMSARYAGMHGDDEANYRKLLQELRDLPRDRREARFVCVLALASPEGAVTTTEGECRGRIGFGPKGKGGFGYDPIFFLPALGRMMAELSPEEKGRLSHRAKALARMVPVLRARLIEA